MILLALIKKTVNLYSKLEFKVNNLLMDPEFEPMRDNKDVLERHTLNTTSAKDHVTEI